MATPLASDRPRSWYKSDCYARVSFVRGLREMQNRYYEGPVPEGQVVPTTFQHTVDGAALALQSQRSDRPAERDLIKVVVTGDVDDDSLVTLRSPFATLVRLPVEVHPLGYITRDWIVLQSGESPAGSLPLPDTQVLYVGTVFDLTAGVDVEAVVETGEIVCGRDTLSVTEIMTTAGGLRIQRYAAIAERTPTVRVVLPSEYTLADVTVLLDYGDDDILDEIDITRYFTSLGRRAIQALVPRSLPKREIPGTFSPRGEALHFLQEPGDIREGELYFFRPGENRIRVFGPGNELLEEGFALHYERADITVVARVYGQVGAPGPVVSPLVPPGAVLPSAMAPLGYLLHRILAFFRPEDLEIRTPASLDVVGSFCYSFYARVQGITPDQRTLELRPRLDLSEPRFLVYGDDIATRHPGILYAAELDTYMPVYPMLAYQQMTAALADGALTAGFAPHSHHMVIGSYTVQRLVEVIEAAAGRSTTIRASVIDSGFGDGPDLTGSPDGATKWGINGARLVDPTRVVEGSGAPEVKAAGDLRHIVDDYKEGGAPLGHGTRTGTVFASDGARRGGDDVDQVVLGISRSSELRMIQLAEDASTAAGKRSVEVARDDPNTHVHMIEKMPYEGTPNNLMNKLKRYRDMVEPPNGATGRAKVVVGAAFNVPASADVAKMESGYIAGDRSNPRSTYTGDNSFRQRVLVVGGSTRVDERDNGNREAFANVRVGEEICVVGPTDGIASHRPDGARAIFRLTSAATPIVAGVVAQLMRLDTSLHAGNGLARCLEYVEATALPLHTGGGARDNQTGFGRVNALAAALAVVNAGLPAEGHNPTPGAEPRTDSFFTYLPIVPPDRVTWYGFEVRALVQNAAVWLFHRDRDRWERLVDAAAVVPPFQPPAPPGGAAPAALAGAVHTYFRSLPYRNAAGDRLPSKLVDAGVAAQAGVVTAAGGATPDRWFTQFAITKARLEQHALFGVFAPSDDPSQAGTSPLIRFPIDLVDMRRTAQGGRADDADIQRFVEDFDDYVFAIAQPV